MDAVNRQVRLAARPSGEPTRHNWAFTEEPVPSPGEAELLVRVSHLSLDPAMRGWMNDQRSYIAPVGLGEVMRAFGAGEVIASKHPGFHAGERVAGMFGVQEYAVSDGQGVAKIDPSVASPPTYLNAFGITGLTAYFGLLDVGTPKTGDTVLVSGAAGAVGSFVGQLAKIKGCRAVGIAGSAEKCAWLTEELGFDAALNYREPGLARRLRDQTPDGVQVFFDNVGGEVLDVGLTLLTRGARVVLCGAISHYNNSEVAGPRNYLSLLINRARMEGFIVFDYAERYAEATAEIAGWLREGKLRSRETVVNGSVADFPDTLLKLFHGENIGKLVLRLA